ncbi:hypothetical protein [Pedobacter sp. Leaf250]|uniref:hypothetical protein n=1 Tax=Pedobacter sp. Leaf250 TaxID=2876559 RepID=UPI001E50FFC4|nr:hypothetical protein [Pedobacter sp. Leaf250]
MKTSIYNKEELTEGYVGTGKDNEKSKVQKEYEKGNEGNEVTSYGQGSDAIKGNTAAKDGYDNTGTQGKDSLSDDAYSSNDENPTIESADSGTGSSSADFDSANQKDINKRDEDDVLNTGI